MAQRVSTNTFGVAKWVVSPDATQGTHTTMTAAIASASSGDTIFVRDGTYTENWTGKAGVSVCAFPSDADTPNVIFDGKISYTAAGTFSITGCRLRTNSDYFLEITGSNACVVNIEECFLECLNNTGINNTNSSASSILKVGYSDGSIATTGITLFSDSSAGTFFLEYGRIMNPGSATTASTKSAGVLAIFAMTLAFPITYSSSGSSAMTQSILTTLAINTIAFTSSGTGTFTFSLCTIQSGTASAISIGSGTGVAVRTCNVNSSNTNAITGAGTLTSSLLSMDGSSQLSNVTTFNGGSANVTKISFDQGNNFLNNFTDWTAFTPTLVGQTTAGATTYVTQQGYYMRIGSMAIVQFFVDISAATGTGIVNIGNLPFTVNNSTNYTATGAMRIGGAAFAWPVGVTSAVANAVPGTTTLNVIGMGTAIASTGLLMANTAIRAVGTIMYRI